MWLSGIIAITNSNDDSASPWKISLWIFTSVKLFPSAVNSTVQFFVAFFINFMTLSDICFILKQSITAFYRAVLLRYSGPVFKWTREKRWRCPWCNGYRHRKWSRRLEFKSWTRMIAFHIALIPLGKVWIQLFSLQLWVNSRTDWVLQPWWGN